MTKKSAVEKDEAAPAPTTVTARGFSLYELTDEMVKLDAELEALGGDISEGTDGEAIAQRVEWCREMVTQKADNTVRYVKSVEAWAAGVKSEMGSLAEKFNAAQAKVKRLKTLCLDVFEKLNQGKKEEVKEIKGDVFKIARQKNGGEVPILFTEEDPTKWPEAFTKWEPVIDKEAVRKSLQSEKPDPALEKLAKLADIGYHIRFK